jgi:hypothetical protein
MVFEILPSAIFSSSTNNCAVPPEPDFACLFLELHLEFVVRAFGICYWSAYSSEVCHPNHGKAAT